MNRRNLLRALASLPLLGWMGTGESDQIINVVEPTYEPLLPELGAPYPSYMMPVEIVSRSVREIAPRQYEVTCEWKIGETAMSPMKMRYTV